MERLQKRNQGIIIQTISYIEKEKVESVVGVEKDKDKNTEERERKRECV